MNLPIDISTLSFMGAGAPEAVVDFATKQPRTAPDGQFLYNVPAVVFGEQGAEVIAVRVAGEPRGITRGVGLKITGLAANPWSIDGRSGISYRAETVEVLTAARSSS